MVAPFPPDSDKVRALREALPATGAGIYLNTGTAGPLSLETAQTMRDAEDWELRTGRATRASLDDFLERMDEARGVVAALVAGDPSAIALTHSTTDGMTIASWAPDWRRGDRAVTTSEEHPAVIGPLLAVRDRFGVELEFVDLEDRSDGDLLDAFDRALRPGTRLVSLSHVSWLSGTRLPVGEIGRMARERGAWLAVDGAQAAGAVPIDVAELAADFYALPGQKWLLGVEGTGALWCSPRAIAEGRQVGAGYPSFASFTAREGELWSDARRFEATTFHRPSVRAFARTVGWLEMYVGLPWAHERSARLARGVLDSLAATPGVSVLTPAARMGTLVTFRIAGWSAEQAEEELRRRIFAILRVVPGLDALRASVGWFNTEEELERFVETVALLARHTPESLPRRPSLVVIDQRTD